MEVTKCRCGHQHNQFDGACHWKDVFALMRDEDDKKHKLYRRKEQRGKRMHVEHCECQLISEHWRQHAYAA